MFGSPITKLLEDGSQSFAVFGEGIFHPGELLVINLAFDNSVALQFTQMLGQHFACYAGREPA